MERLYPLGPTETLAGYSCNGVNVEGDVKSIEAVRSAFWEAGSQRQRADLLLERLKGSVVTDEMVEAAATKCAEEFHRDSKGAVSPWAAIPADGQAKLRSAMRAAVTAALAARK